LNFSFHGILSWFLYLQSHHSFYISPKSISFSNLFCCCCLSEITAANHVPRHISLLYIRQANDRPSLVVVSTTMHWKIRNCDRFHDEYFEFDSIRLITTWRLQQHQSRSLLFITVRPAFPEDITDTSYDYPLFCFFLIGTNF